MAPTVVYLDSSAFAKLYLDENEAEQQYVIEQIERYRRVSACVITYTEVCGVFARYFHEKQLTEEEYAERLTLFSSDWATIEAADVTPGLSILAGQLLKAHKGLRAMDALHLASALAIRETQPLQFLSFDAQLNEVAQTLMPDAFI